MHVMLNRPEIAERHGAGHVARCTVERLMRDMGLHGVRRAKSPRTTRSVPRGQCPADPVNRHFAAFRPNELWVSDITYVRTFGGWVRVALNHRRALQADRGPADLHEPGRLFRGWS